MKERFIQKIVVATDFSPASNRAFAFAVQLATRLKAEVIAVYVQTVEDLAFVARQGINAHPRRPEEMREKVKSYIEANFQTLLKNTASKEVRLIVREGDAADQILKIAEEENADLVATGTRSRSKVATMFLGSTARELVKRSRCPVLTFNAGRESK